MSPEQVRGETLDARSDIFSFGVMLYEMLTAQQPFAGESHEMSVSAILSRRPPPLTRYSRGTPSELERIVRKALRKDRNKRYQTTRDLLVDLKRLKHQLEFKEELARSSQRKWNRKGHSLRPNKNEPSGLAKT
jgi:serine/threonine protein kinase